VPCISAVKNSKNSLGAFGFGNGQNGLYGLKGSAAVAGTALDDAIFGNYLLPAANSPRSVDLWPIFTTGVPNLRPYQPRNRAKAEIHWQLENHLSIIFCLTAGTCSAEYGCAGNDRANDQKFSNEGLLLLRVLGLTDPAYNGGTSLQFIPNMDGFPNAEDWRMM
jgi:hypothetical protein